MINIDRYNSFLLGLYFKSLETVLYGLWAVHGMAYHLTSCILAAIQNVFLHKPKKPPDKKAHISDTNACGLIACPSTLLHDLDDVAALHSESFDVEEQVIVGLDSMCSRHLFIDESDFVSEIKPIKPFKIHGIGGNIKAIGQGTVRL